MKKVKQHFKVKNNKYSIREVVVLSLLLALGISVISNVVIYKFFFDTNENEMTKVYNKVLSSYLGEVDKNELSDAAVNGMMEFLGEKYSIYLDDESTNNLYEKLEGSYEGMGVQIKKVDNQVVIHEVYDDTPAKKAGLMKDDILFSVDGTNLEDIELDKVSDLVKHKSSVNVEYIRDGKTYTVNVNIKKLDTPVITHEIFKSDDKNIGYIYISSFSSSAYKQFKSALEKLENDNIDRLIIDVRGNSGGYLTSANDILELFIKKNKVLYLIEDKKDKKEYLSTKKSFRTYPIVVLVDGGSASASEILASSLKESYGALIVGMKTYGKGKVQQTIPLKSSGMVKYTTANWYTPLGNSINEVGIIPGVQAELTVDYMKNPSYETDNQLQKAIELIKNY